MHPFTLLGDPIRLRIVELLASGEKPVWRLVETLGPEFRVGQPAISHHLRVLRDADFVAVRTDGLSRRYRLAWDALDRLDAAVESLYVVGKRGTAGHMRTACSRSYKPPPRERTSTRYRRVVIVRGVRAFAVDLRPTSNHVPIPTTGGCRTDRLVDPANALQAASIPPHMRRN